VKTFINTPEEFANGHASLKARELFKSLRRKPQVPQVPQVPHKSLDAQMGTITSEQFGKGEVYWGARRFGHRKFKQPPVGSRAIKPLPEAIVSALLEDRI